MYGINIKNNFSEFQIDSVFGNYAYVEGADGISPGEVTFNTPSNFPPVVLIRPSSGFSLKDFKYSSNKYTGFEVETDGASFDYRAYFANVPSLEAGNENFGMRIFNARGEVMYDSGKSPFKIIDVFENIEYGVSYEHPIIENPFYLFSPLLMGLRGFVYGRQGPVYRMLSMLYVSNATHFYIDWVQANQIGVTNSAFSNYDEGNVKVIVCDAGRSV